MKQIRNSLGIVFYEQTIAVSEVKNVGGSCQVRHSAQFQMPDGMTIEDIGSQPSEFAVFLKKHGFKSQKAVVGISARQIVSTPLKIPPIADTQTRQETIQIHLERKLEADFSDIVFDCWDAQHSAAGEVLALMTLKKTLIAIKAFLAACKITPVQVTGTSLGLDLVTAPGLNCNIVNYPASLEVFVFQDRNLCTVLNISKKNKDVFDTELAEDVSRQIKRALWSIANKGGQPNYTVWTTHRDAASVAMPLKQTLGDVKQLEIKNSDGPGEGDELCDIAARLAAGAITAEPVRINFLNGHSAAKTAVIPKQWWSRIAMGAAVIILLLGLYVYGWYADSSAVAEYKQNLDAMSKNVEVAEEMIEQVGHAKQWFSRQPEHLENLRELTLMFPPSSDIWLTSLAVDPSMDQIIAGRATHEDAILDVVDKLKANPSFRDINLQYIRKMGKNTDVMTFAVKYNYRREQ